MKEIAIFVLLVTMNQSSFGQGNERVEAKAINKGRIYTADNVLINGQHMVLTSDSVEYYVKDSPIRYAMSLSEVARMEEYSGDYGLTGGVVGALMGGGIGLAISLGSEPEKSNLPGLVTDEELTTALIIPLAVLGGGLVGYLIGQAIEDWSTVYSKSSALLRGLNIKRHHNGGLAVSYNVFF
ncbi:MAG: hypothetical protein KF749_02920 [Bacteroidetes bacterium]|nr:hypothetical protein [Bacteroidota bacterium]MCW5896768.1 hypothetical protein [Bacteroidota bacterium]